MKKTNFLIAILAFLFLITNLMSEPALAQWWRKFIPEKKPVQEQKAPTEEEKKAAEEQIKAAKRQELLKGNEKAEEELHKKEWDIYLTSPHAKKKKLGADVITFSGNKVISKELSAKGYPESNYTITILEDATIVWETMQNSEKIGIAFWRGELKGEVMQGALNLRPKKGQKDDYYFTTVMPEEKPEEKPASVEPVKKKKK